MDWQVDDYDDDPRSRLRNNREMPQTVALPTAPRKAREEGYNQDRVPRDPPFVAHIANLSYDIDTEDVMNFFGHLRIKGAILYSHPFYSIRSIFMFALGSNIFSYFLLHNKADGEENMDPDFENHLTLHAIYVKQARSPSSFKVSCKV